MQNILISSYFKYCQNVSKELWPMFNNSPDKNEEELWIDILKSQALI